MINPADLETPPPAEQAPPDHATLAALAAAVAAVLPGCVVTRVEVEEAP